MSSVGISQPFRRQPRSWRIDNTSNRVDGLNAIVRPNQSTERKVPGNILHHLRRLTWHPILPTA